MGLEGVEEVGRTVEGLGRLGMGWKGLKRIGKELKWVGKCLGSWEAL